MMIVRGHLHADIVYGPILGRHFWYLLKGLLWGKVNNCRSVTTHLPLEIMHPGIYRKLGEARLLIRFGEVVKKLVGMRLYWENAPLLRYRKWNLRHGQMSWKLVPREIELCLDTGHLILGAKTVVEARRRIEVVLEERGKQIRHLHLHENDFKTDQHRHEWKVLTPTLMRKLKQGRSYIYEKG